MVELLTHGNCVELSINKPLVSHERGLPDIVDCMDIQQ